MAAYLKKCGKRLKMIGGLSGILFASPWKKCSTDNLRSLPETGGRMAVLWTDDDTPKSVTPNNLELYEITRSMALVGYFFVALGAAAVGAVLGVVAYVIAGTW